MPGQTLPYRPWFHFGVDDDFGTRNNVSRERLRAVAERVSDDVLARPIDDAWTAGALFAHIAFWDRYVSERWTHAERSGNRTPVPIDDLATELVNDAALPGWIALPPQESVASCLAAAEAIDLFISSLDDEIVSEVLGEGRERLLDRSIHRDEHLSTLEGAFPPS